MSCCTNEEICLDDELTYYRGASVREFRSGPLHFIRLIEKTSSVGVKSMNGKNPASRFTHQIVNL